MIDALARDLRHAVRQLFKSPAFSLTAVAVLGLGIGANAAIVSIVHGVVLRPLPYPDSSRLVRVWHTSPREQFSGITRFAVSPASYLAWKAQSTAFEHLAMYGFRTPNLSRAGRARRAPGCGRFERVLRGPAGDSAARPDAGAGRRRPGAVACGGRVGSGLEITVRRRPLRALRAE